jgi:hypothetical protein
MNVNDGKVLIQCLTSQWCDQFNVAGWLLLFVGRRLGLLQNHALIEGSPTGQAVVIGVDPEVVTLTLMLLLSHAVSGCITLSE